MKCGIFLIGIMVCLKIMLICGLKLKKKLAVILNGVKFKKIKRNIFKIFMIKKVFDLIQIRLKKMKVFVFLLNLCLIVCGENLDNKIIKNKFDILYLVKISFNFLIFNYMIFFIFFFWMKIKQKFIINQISKMLCRN